MQDLTTGRRYDWAVDRIGFGMGVQRLGMTVGISDFCPGLLIGYVVLGSCTTGLF